MIKILSVNIADATISIIRDKIFQNIGNGDKNNLCISASGAHGIITAKKNIFFKQVLNSFYVNLPDGMPLVLIGRLKGVKKIKRCYGPDFFRDTIAETKDRDIKHFLCGGKEGVAVELKKVCENKFDNKNICGVYSPPFREMTEDELQSLANEINLKGANIVWIGLSTPKQEIFAFRLAKYTNVNFICTVGAAFDFHTGKVKQAPKWMQRISMEWFFRLLMEPKRLWKRYFEIVPLFIWYNTLELIKGEFFKPE